MRQSRKPKETDRIKQKLEHYIAFQRRIDNQIERLEYLESIMESPSSLNLSEEPNGNGDGSSKTERQVLKKMEIQKTLKDMIAEETEKRKELEAMIVLMQNPDEQTVIEMHYIDGAKWGSVSAALFGEEPDYNEHEQRYLKKTLKLHGSALLNLAKIDRIKTANN